MSSYNIALELGTYNTSVFLEGNGVVYYQPTTISFVGGRKARNVSAVGKAAKLMQGKTPEKTIVVNPVRNGVIADAEAASLMLRSILHELIPAKFLLPRIHALVLIPCGISIEERREIEEVCYNAGIAELKLVEKIIASAVGCDMPVSGHEGCFMVNLGGGTAEIAAIALAGIVHGVSLEAGGNKMDRDIDDYLMSKYRMQLGQNTIEHIKCEIGSLFSNDRAAVTAGGQNLSTKSPATVTVLAKDIMEAVLPTYHAVGDAIESVINLCPPETAANIYKSGIVLTGGAAKILGLEQLMNERLKINTFVAPDPEYACIVGGGKLVTDTELLAEIMAQN